MYKKLFSLFTYVLVLSTLFISAPSVCAETVTVIQNPGFETLDAAGGASDWYAYNGWNGSYVALDNDTCHGGGHSARLTKTTAARPYIDQVITVQPNTVYEIRLWVRHDTYSRYEDSNNLRMRYQFYSDASASSASFLKYDETYSEGFTPPAGAWKLKTRRVTSPENARALKLGFYLLENGNAWLDDIEIVQITDPLRFTMETDSVFYYPDQKTGVACVRLTADYADTLANSFVTFTLLDGKKELARQSNVLFTEGNAYFRFDTSLLAYKKKAYTVQAVLYTSNGQASEVRRTEIYKYDRPTLFDADGYMMQNGERFIPTVGYHCYYMLDEAKAHGVNLVQTGTGFVQEYLTNKTQFLDLLDEIYEKGMLAFVSLYAYTRFPCDPTIKDAVTELIRDLKDHPAIYCWGLMDEPFDNFSDPREGMRESYKLIRNLDDKHPVMLDVNDTRFYEEGAKYCDVLAHDPYPPSPYTGAEPAVHVQTATEKAAAAARAAGKPVITINQAFVYHGYSPGGMDERNMWYQALMGGTQGCGYYAIDEMVEMPDLTSSVLEFAREEQAFSYRFFSSDAQEFNRDTNKEFSYRIAVLDAKPYLLILNRSQDEKTAVVSLVSRNGKVSLSSGQLTPLYGCSGSTASIQASTNSVSVQLTPRQTAIFRIDGVLVDTSALNMTAFSDLTDYPADASSIEYLYQNHKIEAVANGIFAPEEAMTRGAFADTLVKTLGLSCVEALRPENYTDIDPDAFYANSVHIARYFGLFKETVGDLFRPQNTLSRAEAFSAFSRGLEIVYQGCGYENESILQALWDSASIPKYAKRHISRLMEAGLIKEDKNHSIRPRQNITRREAANLAARVLGADLSAEEITQVFVTESDSAMLSSDKTSILQSFFGGTDGIRLGTLWMKTENINDKWYGLVQNLTTENRETYLHVPEERIFILCGLEKGEIACEEEQVCLTIGAGKTVLYEILPSNSVKAIPNGSFEYTKGNMPCSWEMQVTGGNTSGFVCLTDDSASVRFGRFALQMGNGENITQTEILKTESTSFTPDTLYTFSAWVKMQVPAGGNAAPEAFLEWLDESGQSLSAYTAHLTDTEKVLTDWKKLTTVTKAPAAAARLRVTLRYTESGVASGQYFWDAFSLLQTDNYVPNGDFQNVGSTDYPSLPEWETSGGRLQSENTSVLNRYLTISGENCYAQTHVNSPCLGGQTCKLSLCYRTGSQIQGNIVRLRLIWRAGAPHHISVSLPATKGQWQEYSLIFDWPTGYDDFLLRLDTGQSALGDIDLDNIRLAESYNSDTFGLYTNGEQCIVLPENLTPIENLGWTTNTVKPGETVHLRAPKGSLPPVIDFYAGIYTQENNAAKKLQSLVTVKSMQDMPYSSDHKDMGFCVAVTIPHDLPAGDYILKGFVWESQSMRSLPIKSAVYFSVE